MDSDDDAVVLWWWLQNKRKKRKYWVHPLIRDREHSTYIVTRELYSDPVKFKDFFRMSKPLFDRLLELVSPQITKKDTNCRLALSAEEKLTITLRYLASGSSFKCLAQYFMRGERTIGLVVADTTDAIWKCLQPLYMPVPDENTWKHIAQRYQQLWSLPHCIGSIDGKHVRIRKFKNTGSTNYNYKGYNSVQLMACADADGCFTTIDVGDLGRNSGGGVFRSSRLGRWLDRGELNLPPAQPLPLDGNQVPFPFFFVGDEAFPLKTYLMRPYPRAALTDEKRISNFRLTLGRKTVECAFGMLTSKFRVFDVPIACSEKLVKSIIASACVLHNYIRKSEGVPYKPNNTLSDIEASHENRHLRVDASTNLTSAKAIREYLTKYFLIPGIAIPAQWQLIHENNN